MKWKLFLVAFAALSAGKTVAAPPRLVVNIVVGSMRAGDLERYADNYGDGGLRRLMLGGTLFTESSYDCQQTTTPVSLATITTGAMPSTHGIIGERWRDYVDNKVVELDGEGRDGVSPDHLVAPTLADELLQENAASKAITIAAEPTSAVVMNGRRGTAFWLDTLSCGWTTSAYYAPILPDWIARGNREKYNLSYITTAWQTLYASSRYKNTRRSDITFSVSRNNLQPPATGSGHIRYNNDLDRMLYTPAGNSAVLGFAKQVIAQYRLGEDDAPDILNICLDASHRISEAYGPESVEVEDMYYRLDRDLGDFLTFLTAQVKTGGVVVILTSDHGTSPAYDAQQPAADRFNVRQFEVVVNSFLCARYGPGDWVLEYDAQRLYLNHNLIYEHHLDLAEIQNETAIFAMQFRGVSHALSATAMRTSYFGSGYAQKMQNSFYPRRSGDVVINLMPGWIEQRERCISASGSMYGYDTRVPLIFYGAGIPVQRVSRKVDMTAVAPTTARLLGISEPVASEGDVLPEIIQN